MDLTAWALFATAGGCALLDWLAVGRGNKALEYVSKPAVVILLIGVALVLEPESGARQAAFLAALLFSLMGDVFLMLPRDLFVFGLGAFLVAHLAYIAGFWVDGTSVGGFAVAAVPVLIAAVIVGPPILRRTGELLVPVSIYMLAISVMLASALAESALAGAGAGLFFASDSLIAWNRYVRPLVLAPVAIIVTYHLAQGLLVLSLAI